ncbi:MAG: beta-glucosidase [Clostridiales bacterium]|jgi:beta-glucosidase|nr:beta-glucosidase [Clostridiales bacterium]
MGFKKGFIWGGASASYQIEGAAYEDGRGMSVWDMFCKQPGRITDGSSGDVACDHYHRYQEDVDIMRELEFKAYRFSVAWPRVLPEGGGKINEKGLDFYDRLVDALLKANITPYATLFHWDYPYALFRRGAWLNPDSPKWFADYAEVVAKRLGDRVKNFFTLNEPQCFIGISYDSTEHAPGISFPVWDTITMMHHVMMGHGLAVKALRGNVKDAQIGFAPCNGTFYPATNSPGDIDAARQACFDTTESWTWCLTSVSDPVMLGTYPEKFIKMFGKYLPASWEKDLETIHQPLDFYGQNIYNGSCAASDGNGGYKIIPRAPGYACTNAVNGLGNLSKWPVTPECLYWGPKFLYERYGKPIYITENGCSCHDVISLDGKVHDPNRIDFLNRYLLALRRAADDGVDVGGYFHWCVTDNFEWAKGYTDRFGLIYCDFTTQQRVIKDSGYWYREVIRANGENL